MMLKKRYSISRTKEINIAMTHEIKIISLRDSDNPPSIIGMIKRDICVSIDGVVTRGILTYEGVCDHVALNPHNIYRLKLDNKLISKHKDYKQIRLEILRRAKLINPAISLVIVERDLALRNT